MAMASRLRHQMSKARASKFGQMAEETLKMRYLWLHRMEIKNGTLALHTPLAGGSKIGSLIVSPEQHNQVNFTLTVLFPFNTHSLIDRGYSGNIARIYSSKIKALENSFSIPSGKPKIFLVSDEKKLLAFILGGVSSSALDNHSISLLLMYSEDEYRVDHDLFTHRLKNPTLILKKGDVMDLYGAAVMNNKWIVCYKGISDGNKGCLVGSISLPEKGGSIAETPLISISEISLYKKASHGQKGMGLGCSVKEMKIESVVSGDDSEVDFFVTVLARCPSKIRSHYSIKIFKISSTGILREYIDVEKMKYSSAIQTVIASPSNNLVVCHNKFNQVSSAQIQANATGMWSLICHEFTSQSNSALQFLGKMEVDRFEGSIAGGSPFKHLALNDFTGRGVKVVGYVAGKAKLDYQDSTNMFSYVKVDKASMTVKNLFFQSPAIGDSIAKSSYVASRLHMEKLQSVDTFILSQNKHHSSVCHIFTSKSGEIEWSCRGIVFSLKAGKYSLSGKAKQLKDPFYSTDENDAFFKSCMMRPIHYPIDHAALSRSYNDSAPLNEQSDVSLVWEVDIPYDGLGGC